MQTRIKVEHCGQADQEHLASRRQYAHTYHRPGVICVASKFWDLPETNQLGLLLHEVGHLLKGDQPHSEEQANQAVYKASGVRVWYRDGAGGPELEWIDPKDKERAKEFLGL